MTVMKNFLWLRTGAKRTAVPEYTGEKVRRWMREDLDCPQAQAVRLQVERLSTYLHEPRFRARYKGLESYYYRLPSILSMYLRGLSIEEIADYYRPVFTTFGVTHSIEIVAEHIAQRLNKGV